MDWKLILQIAGIALGLLYLWLEYRADIRLWIVGLVMPMVHGALYYKAGLYADCSMQVYYVLAGLYGWIVWRNVRKRTAAVVPTDRRSACAASPSAPSDPAAEPGAHVANSPARTPGTVARTAPGSQPGKTGKSTARTVAGDIARTPLHTVPALFAAYAAAHTGIYLMLDHFTNSTVPFWDSLTTALSIVAMWMLSRKYIEQWLVWLVVDLVTVGLYAYKGISFTAGLYALYSALAVAGYLRWRKQASAKPSVTS